MWQGVNIMSRKIVFLSLLVVFLFVVAPVAAKVGDPPTILIETEDYGFVRAINDGRLNGLDPKDGHTYEVDEAYELLAIDRLSNNGYLVLRADAAAIRELMTGVVDKIEANGFTLGYSPSNYFWVSAPADAEGKVYTFQWKNTEFPIVQ
jgi:hypothetical protein